jgi:two-component system cell cycle sensor histidine kinase/response regulator CckA
MPHNAKPVILVVDDEAGVRRMVRVILERAGYEVVEAANALEGQRIVEQERSAALLLTDIVMPGKNGLWLAAHVHQFRPELPVLFMSGFAQDYQDELSGSVCIRKPFTPAQLVAAVMDILGATHSAPGGY